MSRGTDATAAPLVVTDLRGAIVGPISLTVEAGSCAAIRGASGSGKSLFLRMIADLDPSDGEVCLGPLHRAAIAAPDWRRKVMYLPAEAGWWAPDAQSHVPPDRLDEASDLAHRLGLRRDLFTRAIATLSSGEKQRLALVRSLVRRPQVLLLDEPTSALDPASTAAVEEVLRERRNAGLVLIVVSHDTEQARRLGTALYEMRDGRLVAA